MFGLGKKKGLIGLDIGSYSIKIAELTEERTGYNLVNVGMALLPPDAISEGVIRNHDVVAETIRSLVENLKIKEKGVATSISGFSVIIKKIEVPTMPARELDDLIYAEATKYIPYNMEEVNISYQTLGEAPSRPKNSEVLLVAAKKDIVDEYSNLLRSAGLEPRVIDVDFFALQNAYELNYPPDEGCVALIDIGATKMNINVVKNGSPLFTRDASAGGYQITHDIQNKFGVSYEEAERIKLGEAVGEIEKQELQNIFVSAASAWSIEIKRVIDFFYATYPEDKIVKIIISGGSARLPGFDLLLSKDTGISLEHFNPLANLEIDPEKFDLEYLSYIAPQMAISIGLGLRRVDEK